MEICDWSALQLGEALKIGEISVAEATRAALDRIAVRQPENNAFITILETRAMETADLVQRSLRQGTSLTALTGVPMALKDNICTLDIQTSCASRMLETFQPPYSATLVEKLDAAGGILLGKLNMDEFAMGSTSETSCYGSVKNPWDLTRVPGGSSGGAAAAVAAGECWYAIGSDTGGSIRQPAAHCGVTGMKPTYGAVSRYGLVAHASSLDQMGPIARSAADCAAVLDLIMGHDRRDGTSWNMPHRALLPSLTGDLRGMKVGIPADCFGEGLAPEVSKAVNSVADVLAARGAQLETFALPMMQYVVPTYYVLSAAEASSNLARYDGVKYGHRAEDCGGLAELYRKSRSEGFGPEVKRRILLGTFLLSAGYYEAYYQKALWAKTAIKQAYDAAFRVYDLLLTPVTPTTAPKLGASLQDPLKMYLSDLYTVPLNLAGLPGISIPCGFDRGLPIGAQLIGPTLGELQVLNAAHGFQLDTGFHTKRPRGGAL